MVKKADLITSVVLIILSLIILVWVIPQQIVVTGQHRYTGPATFPRGAAIFMFVLNVIYFLGVLRGRFLLQKGDQAGNQSEEKPQYGRLLIFLAILILYVLGFGTIGFYVCTALFLAILMFWFDRKNIIGMVLMATTIPLFIYLVFEVGLRVFMPRGLFF
ncbi:MAG: tripartite tricarboxylate transporter TctB family protein [Bacillota bacterium]